LAVPTPRMAAAVPIVLGGQSNFVFQHSQNHNENKNNNKMM
jgi:hypothetical protein